MSTDPTPAIVALDRRFMLDHPLLAAREIERLPLAEAVDALQPQPATVLAPVLCQVVPDQAVKLLTQLQKPLATELLTELLPTDSARLLTLLTDTETASFLAALDATTRGEIERLLNYPPDTAGRLMQTRIRYFRGNSSVDDTLESLRAARAKAARSLFIVDDQGQLSGRVSIQDIAVAPPGTLLQELARPVSAAVSPVSPRAEVVELLERHKLVDLPVVDIHGRLLGVIYHATLIQAMQEDATADIQTMVGVSRDERALSTPLFAVRKRLPWLQINLLTAFLAAAVVGVFEDTIARFTALAVLLPVVAGQSGNAGAQALAVTMRGLALREITIKQWAIVTWKEARAGFVNGIAVALTCGVGVFLWSGSLGLVAVIAMSMVLAMVAAGLAGAIVPITLTKLGQDPAQSSSIILTTVTDVAGFMSFLGIATLLATML